MIVTPSWAIRGISSDPYDEFDKLVGHNGSPWCYMLPGERHRVITAFLGRMPVNCRYVDEVNAVLQERAHVPVQ